MTLEGMFSEWKENWRKSSLVGDGSSKASRPVPSRRVNTPHFGCSGLERETCGEARSLQDDSGWDDLAVGQKWAQVKFGHQ